MESALFHTLNICNFVICASMGLIAPFFPTYAFSQGLGSSLVGFIFSLHPLGGMIGSVIIGKRLTNQNRMKYMIFAMTLQAICLLAFIFTYLVRGFYIIALTACVTRFLNGVAYSAVLTSFYSYIPFLFPHQIEQKIALAETASALGYSMGPFFGSLLYSIGGFIFPFLFFAVISFYAAYYIKDLKVISIQPQEMELKLVDQIECATPKDELMYLQALGNYNVFMNALMAVMVTTSFTITFPILAQYLQVNFQKEANTVGFYMSIGNFAYAVSTPIMIYMKKPNKPIIIFLGQFINGLAQFFQGPDKLFTGLDKNLMIFCLAQFANYFSAAFTLIYSLPQMTEYLIKVYPGQDERCTTISSALFSASISLGEFSGPLIAGVLNNFFEYDRIASIIGIILLIVCIAYIPTIRK